MWKMDTMLSFTDLWTNAVFILYERFLELRDRQPRLQTRCRVMGGRGRKYRICLISLNALAIHYSQMLSQFSPHCCASRTANTAQLLRKHVQLSKLLSRHHREQMLCKHRLEVSHTTQTWALPLYPDLLPALTMPATPASRSTPLTPILSNLTALPIPATTLTETKKAALRLKSIFAIFVQFGMNFSDTRENQKMFRWISSAIGM
jgi:hypothetical protein